MESPRTMKQPAIQIPLPLEQGGEGLLLHACCAPCSSAIVEWLMAHGVRPTIFYFNPNIWPREEYLIRKNESKRHAEALGLRWTDGDYRHDEWLEGVCGLKGGLAPDSRFQNEMAQEPERGRRCQECFTFRLIATAREAKRLGLRFFATTLASSRWKSLEQIERAGRLAEQTVEGTTFWAQNWRKGGLQERRNQLLREYHFYNQQYCGCEFSARQAAPTKVVLRQQMRDAKRQHQESLPAMSAAIVESLLTRLAGSRVVMAYWPLPDEVDIRPLIYALSAQGKVILLPKVTGDDTMELRRYTSRTDLAEGAFHIQEPVGGLFTDYGRIDVVLVPGVAFDAAGHRLGRGRGYYDRFLSAHPLLHKIGICFPFQRVAEVPAEPHDVCMDEIC